MTQRPDRNAAGYAGNVLILGYITGVLALLGALFCAFSQDRTGMALCLVAAALAFGLLANASLRQ